MQDPVKDMVEYRRSYYLKNKGRAISNAREYQKDNEDYKTKRKEWLDRTKEERKLKLKLYREFHKEEIKAKNKLAYLAKQEERKAYAKEYRQNHPEKVRQSNQNWRDNHKEAFLERTRADHHKHKSNPQYKIRKALRSRLKNALKHNLKTGSAIVELGCSIDEFKTYLESKFQPGMSWENHSFDGWHIDHIKPLASFDLTDLEQFKQACHYTNLQPLWAKDNLSKSAKVLK